MAAGEDASPPRPRKSILPLLAADMCTPMGTGETEHSRANSLEDLCFCIKNLSNSTSAQFARLKNKANRVSQLLDRDSIPDFVYRKEQSNFMKQACPGWCDIKVKFAIH